MLVNRKYYISTLLHLTIIVSLLLFTVTPGYSLPEPLVINDIMENIRLDQHLACITDRTASLTISDIAGIPAARFNDIAPGRINFGYSDATYWFRMEVNNQGGAPVEWILESRYPLLDYLTFYVPDETGFKEMVSGDRLPYFDMSWGNNNYAAPVKSPPGISVIFIKIRTEGSTILKIRAWDHISYLKNTYNELSVLWFFYGVLITLGLFNLFLFSLSKYRTYLALASLILSETLFILIHNGMARKYLWPNSPWWANYSHPVSMYLLMCIIIIFSKILINTRNELRIIHRILNGLLIILSSLLLISFFVPYGIATRVSVIMFMFTTVLTLTFTVPLYRFRKKIIQLYLASWSLFFLGTNLLALRSFSFLADSFVTEWGYQIGIASGSILVSIVMTTRLGMLRKQSESAISSLRESEKRYRMFFETAHDGILYIIGDIPVYANQMLIRMTGYDERTFYMMTVNDLFIVNDGMTSGITDIFRRATGGEVDNLQFEALLKNKHGRTIDVTISLSTLPTGINSGTFMIITDISSLKKALVTIQQQYTEIRTQYERVEILNKKLLSAQENLRSASREIDKEKEYLSATLASIGDGVITYDTESHVFLINRIAEELIGVSYEDAIGKKINDILIFKEEASSVLFFDTLGTANSKYRFNNIGVPFEIIGRDGLTRVIEINSAIIKLEDKPLGIVLAMRDITIKNRIDKELIKMSKLESIGILAGGIAHDFNNLLTGISGNISVLKNTNKTDMEIHETIHDVEKAVNRATALTKQLLTFAKGGEPLLTSSSIVDVINESVKFIVKNPEIKCDVTIEEELCPVMIDPNQISQAINNLIINSIQAMPHGGRIKIEAKNNSIGESSGRGSQIKPGNYVTITIEDTGCGIPQENLNKIFDPFFTTKTNGTGLGLTSTYSIIKKHRGYIEARSAENTGCTFVIYLRASEKPITSSPVRKSPPPTGEGGTILVMDDEVYILDVLVRMLKYEGYEVDCAKSGDEAIKLYLKSIENKRPYNHVILDLTVYGGMGGKETLSILKSMDPDVKAIVSSGYSDNPIMANYREHGFTGVLTKPYVVEDVLKVLKNSET